ncbi:hypothetical protein AB4428_06395 [Vibrio lentus]
MKEKSPYDHSESRAMTVSQATQMLNVSEETLMHYFSREGSLETAIAAISYRQASQRMNTPYLGVRFPFLMPPLWRIALGVPDY